jgi:hypothetical protein
MNMAEETPAREGDTPAREGDACSPDTVDQHQVQYASVWLTWAHESMLDLMLVNSVWRSGASPSRAGASPSRAASWSLPWARMSARTWGPCVCCSRRTCDETLFQGRLHTTGRSRRRRYRRCRSARRRVRRRFRRGVRRRRVRRRHRHVLRHRRHLARHRDARCLRS